MKKIYLSKLFVYQKTINFIFSLQFYFDWVYFQSLWISDLRIFFTIFWNCKHTINILVETIIDVKYNNKYLKTGDTVASFFSFRFSRFSINFRIFPVLSERSFSSTRLQQFSRFDIWLIFLKFFLNCPIYFYKCTKSRNTRRKKFRKLATLFCKSF